MAARGAQVAALRAKQALQQLMLSRQAALRLANAQRSAVLARYREAVAEEQRIRAALRGWALKSGEGRYGGGQLLMAVNGWKSSDFGERYDPYYRVWQLHAGTDFAAPRGTPIHAARCNSRCRCTNRRRHFSDCEYQRVISRRNAAHPALLPSIW